MGLFEEVGVKNVYHYTPLHYLPFIARSQKLLSKQALYRLGFQSSHFRTKSRKQDAERGFSEYAFLTLDSAPNILKAKFKAGFPHISLSIPAQAVDAISFSLCRYNIAMARYLRRNGGEGFPESPITGRYYGKKQIPIARTASDKRSMLQEHLPKGTMIEVLIRDNFILPEATTLICFSAGDVDLAQKIIFHLQSSWKILKKSPPSLYNRQRNYAKSVIKFIDKALVDPEWHGNGLEFDRI